LRGLIENTAGDQTAAASLRVALEHSLHLTFVAMFLIAALTAAVAAFVPKIHLSRRGAPAKPAAVAPAGKRDVARDCPSAAE